MNVKYFAIFRELSGLETEVVQTSAHTLGELYAELASGHGFRLPGHAVRASVHRRFVSMDRVLADGDEVVFIPPVAGG